VTLLPIAVRELRVSARNKATHRLRTLFAVGAVTIAGGIAFLTMMSGGFGVGQLGGWIFGALTWIAFGLACAAGVFLTADCLSDEKREGTLGLLFLTDLRGHDVVLGKLLATSLRTFYSLLAIFPVMGFSFILGGVAVDDFWHSLVSLCNTLFFSLALGMAVSVLSRDSHRAMTATLVAMVVFLLVPPGLDLWLLNRTSNKPLIGLLSPLFAFNNTDSFHARDFWFCIIIVHVMGWGFLALASWLAPKTWQDKPIRIGLGGRWRFLLFNSAGARSRSRILLNKNPICWIIARDRWAANLARLALLLILGVFALSVLSVLQNPGSAPSVPATTRSTTITSTNSATTGSSTTVTYTSVTYVNLASGLTANSLFVIANWCAGALALALEFWLTAHVCRFYVDGRRNGFFELLLVTPVRPPDILRGHWLALSQLFLVPVAAQLFLTLSCGAVQIWADYSVSAGVGISQIFMIGLGAVNWCLGLFTIVWFSIWMGVTSRKINIAILKTISYAKILPWFGITFAWGVLLVFMAKFLASPSGGGTWLIALTFQLMFTLANVVLIGLARGRARVAFSKWAELAAI
jgi:ABC-type transport system involved in cytochrome c biogenesis permease component